MFGLQFLNPIFLAGLAAAALPILIHLFSRRRAREIPFPSLEYLQEISRQKVRRMRLRQWLLLALRVLILALFALAMGRPAIQGGGGVVARGTSTVAILIDNSYSMAAADPRLAGEMPTDLPEILGDEDESRPSSPVPEEGTLFARAKGRAEEILDLMAEGDRGVLALGAVPVTLPFQTPVADAGLLRQEVRRASLAADRADLAAAVEQLIPTLVSAHTLNRELFIISDFQRVDLERWIQVAEDADRGAARDSVKESGSLSIPEGVKVYLVPVRSENLPNLAVERIRYDGAGGVGQAGRLVVSVVNYGGDPVTEKVIRASAASDGTPLSDGLFGLPPSGRGEVELDLSALPADGAVEVRLGADLLEWDNRAYLVTGDPGVRRILLVGGSPEDARFVRTALDPEGSAEFFRVTEVEPEDLSDPTVLDADVVVLANVGRLSDGAVDNLARFRSRGGGILIGLGDRIDPRSYNTAVLARLSSIELLNILQDEGAGTYRSLRPLAHAHAIFSGFPVGPGDDLGSARFRKIMSSRGGTATRVLAEFGRGIPAILEEDGILVFTSSLDGTWNDFITSASFLPLLHKMVIYLATRGLSDERSGRVGTRLETLVPDASVAGPIGLVEPGGAHGSVEATPVERMVRLRSDPVTLPGVYRFVDDAGQVISSFAVNLDPVEGDLALAPKEARGRLFGRDAITLPPEQQISRELLEGRFGREIWRVLLALVLGLLVMESVLGRGRLLN